MNRTISQPSEIVRSNRSPEQFGRRGFLGAAAAWACAPTIQATPRRPNVLLITADDLNWDSVGVFGGRPKITPNIDRLASQGMRFQHAHVTVAVCQPSRSVLMTGRYPHRNGAEGFTPIRPDIPTLQEQLRAGGYVNGILAKTGHLAPPEKFCWDYFIPPNHLGQGRNPSLYYEHTQRFIEQAKSQKKPFFLMANSQDPHRPFAGSEAERVRGGKNTPFTRKIEPHEAVVPGFLPDIPEVRREVAEYLTSVHRCDETVGQILRALEESGLAADTLVMFLSDNGMAFPFSKANCYLAGTRTPWIVRWPGRVKPDTVNPRDFISGIDFTPTILDAADLPRLQGVDGRSFVPLLGGRKQPGRDTAITMFHETSGRRRFEMRCIQDRRFGYIYNAWADGKTEYRNESQSGLTFAAMARTAETSPEIARRVRMFQYRVPEEFYDFAADPNCLNNLIDRPEHRREAAALKRALLENMKRTGDPVAGAFQKFVG